MKKHFINENFFDSVDDEVHAYILGFFYADGCIYVHPSTFAIECVQLEQDKDILIRIKEEMQSDYPLTEAQQKENGKKKYTFYAFSKKLFDQLNKLGVTPRKSLTLKFPDFLDDSLMPHFIRGYFDGDGCIWNGKRRKMLVKDELRLNKCRERIVHNVKFTFTGFDGFIIDLQKFLVEKIGIKLNKLNYSKANNPNNKTSKHVCTMEYSGRGNIKKLYDYMYENSTIHGLRKFNKFKEILCANSK